jgi:TatA/E family protein of Tat protein translocase
MQPIMTPGMSYQDPAIITAIFVVLFGGKNVGELGEDLGEGIRNFKAGMKENTPEEDNCPKEPDKIAAKRWSGFHAGHGSPGSASRTAGGHLTIAQPLRIPYATALAVTNGT